MLGHIFNLGARLTLVNELSPVAQQAGRDMERLRDRIQNADQMLGRFQGFQRMAQAGTFLSLTVSGPVAAALGGFVREAIAFESAFVGVRRTVDATDEQFDAIADTFDRLSREIPVSAVELARIGQVAGQLGVRADDIATFTEVVAKMGATTELSTEAAALGLARIGAIMQIPMSQADRMASSIVALGNTFATSEPQIVEFSQRIAGAGQAVGLSAADVFGLSAALAQVGLQADAGGTAVSRVLIMMAQAVAQGGEDLELFSAVAGSTAQEFAEAFRGDPVMALSMLADGLGALNQQGEDVFTILQAMGMGDVRVMRTMLNLAGAQGLLTEAIDLSREAWEENIAMEEEFGRILETTGAKIAMATNSFTSMARSIGRTVLPVLNTVLGVMGRVFDVVADAPPWVHVLIASLMGLVAVAGPLLFTVGVVGQLVIGIQALTTVGQTLPIVARGIALLNSAAGTGAAIFRVFWAAVTGPIGWVIGAATLLYLAWQNNFLGIKDIAADFAAWIKGLWEGIVEAAVGYLQRIVGWFSSLPDRLAHLPIIGGLFGGGRDSISVETTGAPPDEGGGFWSRLFGRGDDRPDEPGPIVPVQIAPRPAFEPAFAGAPVAVTVMPPEVRGEGTQPSQRPITIGHVEFRLDVLANEFGEAEARHILRVLQRVAEEEEERTR